MQLSQTYLWIVTLVETIGPAHDFDSNDMTN
jgi:hypothetical protein